MLNNKISLRLPRVLLRKIDVLFARLPQEWQEWAPPKGGWTKSSYIRDLIARGVEEDWERGDFGDDDLI